MQKFKKMNITNKSERNLWKFGNNRKQRYYYYEWYNEYGPNSIKIIYQTKTRPELNTLQLKTETNEI